MQHSCSHKELQLPRAANTKPGVPLHQPATTCSSTPRACTCTTQNKSRADVGWSFCQQLQSFRPGAPPSLAKQSVLPSLHLQPRTHGSTCCQHTWLNEQAARPHNIPYHIVKHLFTQPTTEIANNYFKQLASQQVPAYGTPNAMPVTAAGIPPDAQQCLRAVTSISCQ